MARSMVEERLTEAQGGREVQTYLRLEFAGRGPPPTAIPVRWTTRAYKPLTRLRLWFMGRVRKVSE